MNVVSRLFIRPVLLRRRKKALKKGLLVESTCEQHAESVGLPGALDLRRQLRTLVYASVDVSRCADMGVVIHCRYKDPNIQICYMG